MARQTVRPLLTALLLLAPLAGPARGAPPGLVQVTDSGLIREAPPPDQPALAALQRVRQAFTFANGTARYTLDYHGYWDAKSGAAKPTAEGYLGLPQPSSCNWYGGGFLDVLLDGASLGTIQPAPRLVEQGPRGLAELLWKAPQGQVRLRVLQEPGQDYLAVEVAFAPPAGDHRLTLALRCFPSYFTSWNKRDGWRQVIGPATQVEQGKTAALDPARDPWLLYQDRVFDVALKAADSAGPCALLLLPEQVAALQVAPTSYPVATTLTLKPEVRSARLALWEFPKKTNAESLQRLREGAAAVTARLRALDFGDSQVAACDLARERAALAAMLAKVKEPGKWQPPLAALLDQVEASRQAARNADLEAERAASEALAKYREAVWELRFEALLSD